MKKFIPLLLTAVLVCAAFTACGVGSANAGWTRKGELQYLYDAAGRPVSGWQTIDGASCYFLTNGQMAVGWQTIDGQQYYFDENGSLATGWLDLNGSRYYLRSNGTMVTGWLTYENEQYHFDLDGILSTGWQELEGHTYYFGTDGAMRTGWLELGGQTYYLNLNGHLAIGKQEIDGKTHYFTSTGAEVLLVNPWNYVPEDYSVVLVEIGDGQQIAVEAYEDYLAMMAACEEAGMDPVVCSSYRSQEQQEYLYERRIERFMDEGYSRAKATELAGTVVAVPGTSEHQLGLALDIVDNNNWNLDESQAEMPTQQWLMEHSWEYGFILRYPNDKSELTGIIYEPWHYRYVGRELAAELHETDLCLEEYLQMLTAE